MLHLKINLVAEGWVNRCFFRRFSLGRHIESLTWPANNPDLNLIENLLWKFFKIVNGEALFAKKNQLPAIQV